MPMATALTESQLEGLRSGDRLSYHGAQWQVAEYSTYDDPNGYATKEWLLKSELGKEHYLLQEIDPQSPNQVNWYLAEEVKHPRLAEPDNNRDLTNVLWGDMMGRQVPPPSLQSLGKQYSFESETEGSYTSDGEDCTRVTWDYWDKAHQWNLALEAFPDSTFRVYSTKVVTPADFSSLTTGKFRRQAPKSGAGSAVWGGNDPKYAIQVILALMLIMAGVVIMIVG